MSEKPTRGEIAAFALFILILMLAMSGCAAIPGAVSDPADVRDATSHLPGDDCPTHNLAGGYIEACGELPGLLGDDC